MPNTIQQNRYDQLLRRVGGLYGPGSKLNEILGELFPVIDVEDVPAELLALGGTRLFLGRTVQAAVAAVFQQSQVFNPVDSGNLLVVTRFAVDSTTAQNVSFGVTTTELAVNTDIVRYQDTRLDPTTPPVALVKTDTSGAVSPIHGRLRLLANVSTIIETPKGQTVLSPGHGFTVTAGLVNTDLGCTFWGYERVAERSELVF